MYAPYEYAQINLAEGSYSPSQVNSCNNVSFAYWERSLFQRACSVIKLNVPDTWEGNIKDFLYYCLFKFGYVSIFNRAELGTVFQPCKLSGYDFYYQPVTAQISNPLYTGRLEIGKECELLKLTPDYMGIWDIISYYAEKLSTLDNAINMSLINNKFAYLIGARNKTAGQALKKMFDKMNKGEPAVIYDMKLLNDPSDKAEPWQFLERKDLKASYLTTDQLHDFQTLINNFDAEIGIPTIPEEKKERMVTSEAESRVIDSVSRSTVWYDTLTSSIKRVNKMFPELGLSVELRYSQEGGEADEDNDDRLE